MNLLYLFCLLFIQVVMNTKFNIFTIFLLGCVIFAMVSTALFCRKVYAIDTDKKEFLHSGITDALLTILTILLLTAYTTIQIYVLFLLDYFTKEDFTIITVRK